jgi:hypothetical protein
LAIAIPACIEEHNLAVCLQSIGTDFACRVMVIDSVSIDVISAVAGAHVAKVMSFHWNGHVLKKRTWFLRHHAPSCAFSPGHSVSSSR